MKQIKIVFLLALLFSALLSLDVVAQTDPYNAADLYDQYMDYGENRSYIFYDGTLANGDTIGVNDSTWSYKVYIKSLFSQQPSLYVDLDSIGGIGDTVYVDLRSKSFPDGDWTVRERSTWTSGTDTEITLRSDSAHRDEFWEFLLHGQQDSMSVLIDDFILKTWEVR